MLRSISGILLGIIMAFPSAAFPDPYEDLSVIRLEKKPAPDFSLPSVNGKAVSLSDYRGRTVLLGFFKTF